MHQIVTNAMPAGEEVRHQPRGMRVATGAAATPAPTAAVLLSLWLFFVPRRGIVQIVNLSTKSRNDNTNCKFHQVSIRNLNLKMSKQLQLALVLALALIGQVLAGAVSEQSSGQQFDSPALKVISDEDRTSMHYVKTAIDNNYSNLKDFDDVYKLLNSVKLLVQKHSKNIAFAQGELKELHKFLSQEVVTKLIRVDTEPFDNVQNDESKMDVAQRAAADDELTSKLFGAPLRSLVEAKRQEHRQQPDSNHRDGNFFSNFWCKLSGNCSS